MYFTVKALEYIRSQPDSNKTLRVKVVGGGCSGLSYAMEFTDYLDLNDCLFWQDGMAYAVDNKSWLFLRDVEIDYSDGLNGKGFTYNNPSSKRTCGCGSSFGV